MTLNPACRPIPHSSASTPPNLRWPALSSTGTTQRNLQLKQPCCALVVGTALASECSKNGQITCTAAAKHISSYCNASTDITTQQPAQNRSD
eukprot:CAMPEP_0202338366 /NCGR_PEP_ID=MMETSP1126-20121109/669_1 /ASSEMBLY_ACC=CAM_ASM_000457 /TAXON_ID=3047 /ORGANISM="Dunaliella tertiolecta, Strain CCMP1320" /LENGTH=91 /DNA_ID=CAMNT_0048928727 /DNA_START=112 /DNA_END=384 /DNA_ORIENTATION=+